MCVAACLDRNVSSLIVRAMTYKLHYVITIILSRSRFSSNIPHEGFSRIAQHLVIESSEGICNDIEILYLIAPCILCIITRALKCQILEISNLLALETGSTSAKDVESISTAFTAITLSSYTEQNPSTRVPCVLKYKFFVESNQSQIHLLSPC